MTDTPRPGENTEWWIIGDRHGWDLEGGFSLSEIHVREKARSYDERYPKQAPHRVLRLVAADTARMDARAEAIRECIGVVERVSALEHPFVILALVEAGAALRALLATPAGSQ